MMLRVDDLAGEDAEGVEHRAVALQGEDALFAVGGLEFEVVSVTHELHAARTSRSLKLLTSYFNVALKARNLARSSLWAFGLKKKMRASSSLSSK
jgi:hypothetical protein